MKWRRDKDQLKDNNKETILLVTLQKSDEIYGDEATKFTCYFLYQVIIPEVYH